MSGFAMFRVGMRNTRNRLLLAASLAFLGGYFLLPAFGQTQALDVTGGVAVVSTFRPFSLFFDARYSRMEVVCLVLVMGVAVAGLLYAWMLAKQILKADCGTARMQAIADAVCYLASDSAEFMTGTVLDVNGGMFMN